MNQPASGGIFDKPQKPKIDMTPRPAKTSTTLGEETPVKKVDMKDEFQVNEKLHSDMVNKSTSTIQSKMQATEDAISKANDLMNSAGSRNVDKELEEMEKISERDQELAEALIFNGYAEYEVVMVNLPKAKFTLCSTSADDVALVDEMIFEFVRSKEDQKTGAVDIAETNVKAFRLTLTLSLSYKGRDGKDFMDAPVHQLSTIKKAIQRCKDLEAAGDLDQLQKLRAELKAGVKRRASRISALPTPVIDYLSQQRYEFDSKMYSIMTTKNLLPKF